MAVSPRRVVITGIGVCTPIGLGTAAFWEGLAQGRNGIRAIRSFDAGSLTTRFAGEIEVFDAKSYIDKKDRKSLRVMARSIQLAVAAAQLALDDGKIDKEKLDPARFGVDFGAGLLATELPELGPASQISSNDSGQDVSLETWGGAGLQAITPLWMLKYLPNMLACHVSILHNAQGPNNSVTESDAASLLALGEAARILKRDQADFMLVGGADSKINPVSMVRQCLFKHLSTRNEAPEKACRPFDRNRDGIVLGEGAGVLALEDLGHAQARGATIYGEVLGFCAAFDRGCRGAGLARAVRQALAQADLKPDDIGHVNAHGLSSVSADAFEARGLAEVFGANSKVPVWAVKSYVGNFGAGSGVAELTASLLAVRHKVLPGTLNYEEPDPECPVTIVRGNRPLASPYFLKVGFTEMGQCAAVVCKGWE